MKKNTKGFTLIELLVVIAIIGVLSAIILASFGSARQKSRTARRISDINEIKTALELYYHDYGVYPSATGTWRSECAAWGGYTPNNVIPELEPNYLNSFPSDPSMNKANSTSCYLYMSNGTDYALLDHNIQDPGFSYASQPSLIDPTRDSGTNACLVDGTGIWSWKVSSLGGACW